MKIELETQGGRRYELLFKRVTDSRKLPSAVSANLFRVDEAMMCYVTDPLTRGMEIGWALCSRSEPGGFDPAKGRRKSLAHAIHDLPRSLRASLWAAYNTLFPPEKESRSRRQLDTWLSRLEKGQLI